MFEEMSAFLVGFDLVSVFMGFIMAFAVIFVGKSILVIFDFIKWLIRLIYNRNSPPSGEDKNSA